MTYQKFLDEKGELAESLGKEASAAFLYLLYVTKMTPTDLFLNNNKQIKDDEIKAFDEGFKKYLYDNEPIQYLIGYHTFYGYDFIVDKRVLIPRCETEELVENVLMLYDDYFSGKKVNVCDVGTGSGAIAISLALEEPNMTVMASDISSEALEVAELNNQKFEAHVKFLQGDMLEPLKGNKFDIVVSNPPYIPTVEEVDPLVKDNEPNVALFGGNDGLYFYRIILKGVKEIINDKAIIAFEHGYTTNAAIEALANEYLENIKVIHKKDLQGKDRMTFILVGDLDA